MIQGDPLFQTYDYVIGGKMVVGKATLTEQYRLMMEDGDPEAIAAVKSELVHKIALFMLENQLMEFTYYDDPLTFHRQIAIRAYLAPNDQVRILRSVIKV